MAGATKRAVVALLGVLAAIAIAMILCSLRVNRAAGFLAIAIFSYVGSPDFSGKAGAEAQKEGVKVTGWREGGVNWCDVQQPRSHATVRTSHP